MPLLADSLNRLLASTVIMAIVAAALVHGREFLIPLALAMLLTFMLNALVRRLVKHGVPEAAAITGVLAAVMIGVAALTVVLSSQLLELTASLSNYRQNIVDKVRMVSGAGGEDGMIRRATKSVEVLESAVRKELGGSAPDRSTSGTTTSEKPKAEAGGPSLLEHLTDIQGVLTEAALTVLFTVFLMFQHRDLRDRIVRIAGVDNLSGTTVAMGDASERLSNLFFAQAVMNAGFGAVIAVALLALGVPNAMLWGALAALMRFVPFVGSYIAATPPVLLAAGVDPGWFMAIATVLLFIGGEVVMGQVVEPLMLGKRSGLTPFAIIVSASFWTLIWGPIGLLLAAPLTVVLVVLGRHIPALELLSVLLGNEAALSVEQEFYGRTLSNDVEAAVSQLSNAISETSLAKATDTIVLPALGLAAADHRMGRLDAPRLATLRHVMEEVCEEVDATGSAGETGPDRSRAPVALIVPARGAIDAEAARFVSHGLATTSPWRIEGAKAASGLTALAVRGGQGEDTPIGAVVLVTVGGVDPRHLEIMVQRAERQFPKARVLTLEGGGAFERDHHMLARGKAVPATRCRCYGDVQGLLDALPAKAAPGGVSACQTDVQCPTA